MMVPLWQAIAVDDVHGLERALRLGAEVDYRGAGGLTPLLAAAERGALPTAALLLHHRASVNTADDRGRTPLMLAARSARSLISGELVAALLEAHASPHAADNTGRTALHEGAACGHEAVVALLLARGATCDAPTQRGVTPLAAAAAGGHDGALLALLRAGASHGPDADGATPMHVASAGLHATSVALLLSAGGTAASTTHDGSTPLLAALLAARGVPARTTSEEARAAPSPSPSPSPSTSPSP